MQLRTALHAFAAAMLLPAASIGASGQQSGAKPLTPTTLLLGATVDLGDITITYHIKPQNESADVGVQLFAHRDDVKERNEWDMLVPAQGAAPPIISLYKGLDNSGAVTVAAQPGVYGACRLILFSSPDGKSVDFNRVLYDSGKHPVKRALRLGVTVTTRRTRVTSPTLTPSEQGVNTVANGDGTYTVTIPATVKLPASALRERGFWAMAKSSAGFSQVWVNPGNSAASDDPEDNYRKVPVTFALKSVKPGLWNVQFGLFKSSFGTPLQWIWPGVDVEAGGDAWEKKAPPGSAPPRLHTQRQRFLTAGGQPAFLSPSSAVGFTLGGNYGNALDWTIRPALDTPGYFVLLKGLGCRFMRVLFNPDRFLAEPVYQHAVDQVVQNIWAAGLYPVVCPQDLPGGGSLNERVKRGLYVVQALATIYKDKSVWLEICNEPHLFSDWKSWKPVAEQYAAAVRRVDPDAFIVVPLEGYSKDARAAARDPITSIRVDLYDAHAYVAAKRVPELYGPALKAGLPLMIGEYGG
ncbi:MAG TPA: cellulase family glycosylhydrolase, partial [Chthonomonadales bacterium]|nr:cellulase family glycosylhydrolase [Chthonomonadales bacterium]